MTLTLSNLPRELDEALQRRAKSEGKTVDQVALEAILAGLGLEAGASAKRDLSEFSGSWIADPQVDSALKEQDRVDAELWK